jgi:hypothetical protein
MKTATDFVTRTGTDRTYRFSCLLHHAGALISFMMDADRRICYSILDVGAGPAGARAQTGHWSTDPRPLPFATEIMPIGAGEPLTVPPVRLGSTTPVPAGEPVDPDDLDPFLSSTARLSAAAPFRVRSNGRCVYLLRQAITDPDAATLARAEQTLRDPAAGEHALAGAQDVLTDHAAMIYLTDPVTGRPVTGTGGRAVPIVAGTLLMDRFVLAGTTLEAKREVRFQGSGHRHTPAGRTDRLGATDHQHRPFTEPTRNLRIRAEGLLRRVVP